MTRIEIEQFEVTYLKKEEKVSGDKLLKYLIEKVSI